MTWNEIMQTRRNKKILGSTPRGVATGGGGGQGRGLCPSTPHPLQFPNQKRSNSFSFKHQGYLFLRVVQKLYEPEVSRFLPCMLQFLGNLRRHFIFSSLNRSLDLFKRSNTKLWTFWKVSYCGPSERRP